nr:hypothetical protein [uncultured Gellertiella sp.]
MTIKLNSLSRWAVLRAKEALGFDGPDDVERLVRLNLNCQSPTDVWISRRDGEISFLCFAPAGLETIEFYIDGAFSLLFDDERGEVQYNCAEFEPSHFEIDDPVIFTKIAERRDRNPAMEEMLYRAQVNVERRLAQQADEYQMALAAMERRLAEHARTDDQGTTAGASSAPVSAQGTGGEGPGEIGGGVAGGEQAGGSGDGAS